MAEDIFTGREERFINCNEQVARRELADYPVTITTWTDTKNIYGKDRPAKLVRWTGRHLLEGEKSSWYADTSVLTYVQGIESPTLTSIVSPAVPYTEEEIQARNRRIIEVATQCLINQGIW